ncbi:relaxase/mobilization nuclease domain-containing protein [Sphingobacterium spiritivorum]|uniref:relaxase/mobilization nuclease domain-containing protein n=1 Tax=Sphingobacterium spiritivorum TaxID=258 RepID=UPI003DA3AD7F
MVARIKIGKSIRGILHYNEQKVTEGDARIIMASGFATELDNLDFNGKLRRFQHLTELRPSVATNALHISLNFDVSEKLEDGKMQRIANRYMELLGFGNQPFLVYRHEDVSHQHVHIATVSIQADGTSINLHNIGRERSEKARQTVEKEFGLLVAKSKKKKTHPPIKPIDVEKVVYGQIPTKRAVSNVVSTVLENYRFTSLPEYNAVLRQFNVVADRGAEDTEMYRKNGLIYSLLDENGNKVGVPLKASSFYYKPTLANIEKKYEKNKNQRERFKKDIKNRLDDILLRYENVTKDTLIQELAKSGIFLLFRENQQGIIYGATYVDNVNHTVFNGSALGKSYSASAISKRLGNSDIPKNHFISPSFATPYDGLPRDNRSADSAPNLDYLKQMLDTQDYTPSQPLRRRKKKNQNRF